MPVHPLPAFGDGLPSADIAQDSGIPAERPASDGGPRLLDRVRREIRVRHYSIRTESSYVGDFKSEVQQPLQWMEVEG